MHTRFFTCILVLLVAVALAVPAAAQLSGAIFTTVSDGTEVNYNIYPTREAVYLDGGPGPGAPQTAAGLPDGVYVFMVTDPSGKVLLSTDAAQCRQFTVANGIIISTAPSPSGCAHITGDDIDHGATTVQLMPYNFTPNPGGVYKVWATPIGRFPSNCLTTVDCGTGKHGFTPRYSKTDNFKVGGPVLEIDTRFFPDYNHNGYKDDNEPWIDGLGITWYDTVGASNGKWSYLNVALDINHEAHVEAPEVGTHIINVENQTGCTVGSIFVSGSALPKSGPQAVSVNIRKNMRMTTIWVDVACVQ